MTLGQKIALYLLLLGTCIGIGSYAAISYSVLPAFTEFEADAALDTVERVERVIDGERRTFETLLVEYAHWNATYNFVLEPNDNYIEENLDAAYWRTIGVDLMFIIANDGSVVYSADTRNGTAKPVVFDELLLDELSTSHPLRSFDQSVDGVSGLFMTREGPMMMAAAPVLTTYSEGPAVGSFVTLREIRSELVDDVSARAGETVSFYPVTADGAAGYSASELERMAAIGELRRLIRTGDLTIAHRLLRDATGKPAGIFEISQPHLITEVGKNSIKAAMILILGCLLASFAIAMIMLRFSIVRPVNELAQKMQHIRETGSLDIEVATTRSDEIGKLSREFDDMTTNMHLAQQELESTRDVAIEASRTKSEFLARMSHEIRTPMNGVLGMTELLRNTALDFEQRRFADTIYSSADSLLDIINDILDFSKIEAGKMDLESRDIHLGTVIEETVDSLASQAHKKGLELINDVSEGVHTSLQGDPVRIRQVLTNLIANAVKFTNRGEVVVRANVMGTDEQSTEVLFEVVDTGVGIQPDKQQAIFDSFAQEDGSITRTHGGTGLGLAISRQLVDLMGGTLRVESTPGLGSRFYFTLRMSNGGEDNPSGRKNMTSVAGKRILVVDDNGTNREILEQHLTAWRVDCDVACDADEAMVMLDKAEALGRQYHLVVLDMHMPRIDGLQLARKIRGSGEFSDIALMLLSSVAMPASEDVLDELDIAGQLTKPIRQSQLYDSLSVVLSGNSLTDDFPRKGSGSIRSLRGRVLLAEDNPVNQAVALGMLDSMGVDVAVVTDGAAAVEASAAQRFDLVLMDCQMPVMDGLEATRRIRAREADNKDDSVAIVALTANALAGDRERCLEAGMNDYLGKPFTMDQLHAVLSCFLSPADATIKPDEPVNDEIVDPSLFDTQSMLQYPLDPGAFDVLNELQQPGAPCLIEKVIGIYLDSSGELKSRLVTAIVDDDATGIRETAHALKSSSVNVGATRLADLCKQLECMAREENLRDAGEIKPRLEREYTRVIDALNVELEAVAK